MLGGMHPLRLYFGTTIAQEEYLCCRLAFACGNAHELLGNIGITAALLALQFKARAPPLQRLVRLPLVARVQLLSACVCVCARGREEDIEDAYLGCCKGERGGSTSKEQGMHPRQHLRGLSL